MERARDKMTIAVTFERWLANIRATLKRMRPPVALHQGAGWGVYREDGSTTLRRTSGDATFATDEQAWQHVWQLWQVRDAFATAALATLAQQAPREYERVRDYCKRTLPRVDRRP